MQFMILKSNLNSANVTRTVSHNVCAHLATMESEMEKVFNTFLFYKNLYLNTQLFFSILAKEITKF